MKETDLKVVEELALSIRSAIRLSHELAAAESALRDRIDDIERELIQIAAVDRHDDIQCKLNRVRRLTELRRMMELGSLAVELRRVLDAAYQRLP